MLLERIKEADYAAVVQLANVAYRGTVDGGTGPVASWNVEAGIVAGQRLDEEVLREELVEKPELLVWRDEPGGPLLGTVWMEDRGDGVWYLGLLTVRPDLQKRQLGRTLLAAAEAFAKERGGRRITLTVLSPRETLIAWYERRGYRLTGETQPYPYGNERTGRPLREGLYFVVMEREI